MIAEIRKGMRFTDKAGKKMEVLSIDNGIVDYRLYPYNVAYCRRYIGYVELANDIRNGIVTMSKA